MRIRCSAKLPKRRSTSFERASCSWNRRLRPSDTSRSFIRIAPAMRLSPIAVGNLVRFVALLRHLAAALRDQPRGALVAHVDPQPAQRDAEAVAQPDQEIDVGDAPDPPRDCAAQLE